MTLPQMPVKNRPHEYVYKVTLKAVYGLTDKLIRDLGEPDRTVPNPHYRSGPPASLYKVERVERWIDEHSEEVDRAREQHIARSSRALAAAAVKRAETRAWAKQVPLEWLGDIPPRIAEEARMYYLMRYDSLAELSTSALIAYVRHNLTNYEELLAELAGRIGCAEGYLIIRKRVDALVEGGLAKRHLIPSDGASRGRMNGSAGASPPSEVRERHELYQVTDSGDIPARGRLCFHQSVV